MNDMEKVRKDGEALRWLVLLGVEHAVDFGLDFRDELRTMGHEVRTFAYRRENVFYKNRTTKALYQRLILRRFERMAADWRPHLIVALKASPISADVIERVRRRTGALVLNVFPDNPLLMMPFANIEPYDIFFTKDRYAMRQLELVGLRNVYYLPLYCVPTFHYPVDVPEAQAATLGKVAALVGRHYPYRERLVREIADLDVRVWGPGWRRVHDARIRARVAGGGVWGRDKLVIYSGAPLSLNPHHPLNDIVGVNIRAFELAAAGACQAMDVKEDLAPLFKAGEEVLVYRSIAELRRHIEYYLAHPDEARAIGQNARRRALAEHTLRHRIDEILSAVRERFPGRT